VVSAAPQTPSLPAKKYQREADDIICWFDVAAFGATAAAIALFPPEQYMQKG